MNHRSGGDHGIHTGEIAVEAKAARVFNRGALMKTPLALAAGVLLLCGCNRAAGPSVNLVSVHFQKATALETTATFTIRLSNDAPEARHLTGSAHKIYLNGLYVGKGLSDEAVEVPRLGTVTQEITVHLSNLALATRIKSVIEAKRFDYRIQSVFYGKGWLNRMRSESEGKLELKDFTPTPEPESTNAPPAEAAPAAPTTRQL
jgi:LEA14-like dessication related protein